MLPIRCGDQATVNGMVFIVFRPSQKSRLTKSKIKTMLITFLDSKGSIYHEFLPEGQSVNAEVDEGLLKRLLQHIRRVRPELYQSGQWNFLHDNARPHTAQLSRSTQDHCFSTPSLFSRFGTGRLLSVSPP